MNLDPQELPPLENLLAAALYLATNFARSSCPRLSHLLLHQLEFVLNHPRENVSPMMHETCKRLYEVWETIHAERKQAVSNGEPLLIRRQVH
jgi:hypothetical protein